MQKEEFLEKVLNSLADIKPAVADPFLETRVLAAAGKEHSALLRPGFAWFALFCLAALFAMNIYFISMAEHFSVSNPGLESSAAIQSEYFSYINYNY